MKRATSLSLHQRDALIGFALIAPSLLIILGISLQPILSTLFLSLFQADLGVDAEPVFVGPGNYLELLTDETFWVTIGHTLYFTVVSVGLELVLGLAIAQLIHSHPPGWRFLRTSLIIPWAIPTIVNGTMWRWIYNADYGSMNALLVQLGLIEKYVPWLVFPKTAMNLVSWRNSQQLTCLQTRSIVLNESGHSWGPQIHTIFYTLRIRRTPVI